MAGDDFDDDFIADILKEDAKKTAKRYDLVGLEAFKHRYRASSAVPPHFTSAVFFCPGLLVSNTYAN